MFKNKLKNILFKDSGLDSDSNKKNIENLIFFVIVLIIVVVIINYIWNGKNTSNKTFTNTYGKKLASNQDEEKKNINNNDISKDTLENKLEEILSCINGVGEVKVFLNYSESSEVVAMYNENSKTSVTEETDKSGGIRKVEQTDSEKEIVYQEENGNKTPIVKKSIEPKIEGAIITAKGASDINIKTNIIQAVEAVTGLATHKIQVFEKSI